MAKGALDLGKIETEEEKKEQERQAGEYKDLLAKLKDALGGKVKEARVTSRLTQSPACLVAGEHDMGGNLVQVCDRFKDRRQARPL